MEPLRVLSLAELKGLGAALGVPLGPQCENSTLTDRPDASIFAIELQDNLTLFGNGPRIFPLMKKAHFIFAALAVFVAAPFAAAALTEAQLQAAEQQFLANPAQFLAQNATMDAADFATVIQALAANPANLPTITSALANANPAQQTAIGAGLGQAAAAVQQSNPNYANQIQTAVAASGSAQATAGYSSSTGGTQIGTGGGAGGGGGGGGVGGPTGTGGVPSGGGGGGGSGSSGGNNNSGGNGGFVPGLSGGTSGGGTSQSVSP